MSEEIKNTKELGEKLDDIVERLEEIEYSVRTAHQDLSTLAGKLSSIIYDFRGW